MVINKLLQFLIVFTLFITAHYCSSPSTITGEKTLDTNTLRGFTQFKLFRGNDLLGFIPSDGDDNFNFRVWEGKIKKDSIKQNIKVKYLKENAFDINADLKEIFNVGAGFNEIKEIHLTIVNPVEYILENPYPALQYSGRADFLSKAYIGSVMKAEKIKIEVTTKNNQYLTGDSVVKYLKPGAKFNFEQSENATYFARNAYVGYKLFTPPIDAAKLTPFQFVYQFLHSEKGKKGWQLINDRGAIKSGDALKIRVQASHPCYVYIFNIDSKGSVSLLFPDPKIGENPIKGNKFYNFPESLNQGFEVDNNKGAEEFLFMIFREEKPEMKDIVENARSGNYKVEQFRSNNLVSKVDDIKSKGVGGITTVKVSSNEETPGFEFKTNKIQGLPADFKETFILEHK